MQIKTILNRIEKHRSIVYGKVKWDDVAGQPALLVEIKPSHGDRRPGDR